ncbi:hypothetical protein EYF80_002097 [Liparis tanakae]|uniref:Uncharacterized protein n=1 Tax=Liparis tanakae TaxID=230148 RepID=A0A4Z2JC67_9TELE|nr:hypothetical protein EYF80_002097 [Liparis tanakae]
MPKWQEMEQERESSSAATPNSYFVWLLSSSGTPGQPARLGRGDTLHRSGAEREGPGIFVAAERKRE